MQWLNEILEKMMNVRDMELYAIILLMFFTLWFIYSTVKFYKSEKRKVKHLHRFARQGESLSQYELAKRYAKGQAVRKSCQNAASLSQKSAFSGNKDAQKLLDRIIKQRSC